MHCKGCHSPELWDTAPSGTGETFDDILKYIEQEYQRGANAVVFMGGLRSSSICPYQFVNEVIRPLNQIGYDVGLYDGGSKYDESSWFYPLVMAAEWCRWIKTGEYREDLGGLDSPATNQRFYEFDEKNKDWEDRTKEYFRKGDLHEDY